MSGKYKVISTFSGIGGSSQGYKQAGLEVVASIEFLDYQAENYKLNHPNTKLYQCDIRTLDPIKIMNDLNIREGELDILDGSPPCSSFSMAGKREAGWGQVKAYGNKKQRTDDLFFEYVRFLRAIKPKIFVAENVKGLTIGSAIGYFNNILKELKDSGYKVKAKVMNACNYSVPQSRERTIFIGVRNDLPLEPSYPEKHGKIITVREAWNKLEQAESQINECFKIVSKWETVMKYVNKCKQGESAAKYHNNKSFFSKRRLHFERPSPTVTTNNSDLFHPVHSRILTIKELKRIASFPDNYIINGSHSIQWEGIGRSVAPKMMEAIARNIKENILDKL